MLSFLKEKANEVKKFIEEDMEKTKKIEERVRAKKLQQEFN